MTLDELNALDAGTAGRILRRCCGSSAWAAHMAAERPFVSVSAMVATADSVWTALGDADWREAFAAHPAIGSGGSSGSAAGRSPMALAERSEQWSAQEQSAVASAPTAVLARLAAKNREYEGRFGYIFIVCATGRSAEEMLALLERRLANDPAAELQIAAEEQRKIIQLRLGKLLAEPGGP